MDTEKNPVDTNELRQRAEKTIGLNAGHTAKDLDDFSPGSLANIIHDLQVHQVELKMQNHELRRLHGELEYTRDKYSHLYDFAPIGYITVTEKGMISESNLTMASMLGLARTDLIGKSFTRFVHKADQDIFYCHRVQLKETQAPQSCELRVVNKDRQVIYVRLEAIIVPDEKRQDQIRVAVSDISEQRRAEKALSRSEIKYGSMMESLTDEVYICSPEFTVEYMNPAMIKRLGRNATGEVCHNALYGLDHRCGWCVFDKVANGKTVERSVTSPLDRRHYRVTSIPIQNQNKTISKMSVHRDMTQYLEAVDEKEKIQAQLRHAQKMESIGTLAGGIAHDFNNILYPIIGFAELSMDELPENHPVTANLEGILTGAQRAAELVRQILVFSRQKESTYQSIRIQPIIEEALKLLRSTIPANIEMQHELFDDPRCVLCDPTEIYEIVMNLITNASHAMEETGGTLKVRLGEKIPESTLNLPPGDYCCLSVRDTGTGIAPEMMKIIYEPYFTTKEMGKGTGLGLAVVHGIVKKCKGAMTVDSEPGKGAVFYIYLPLILASEKQAHMRALDRKWLSGNEHILFVDDEETIMKLGIQILEKFGYQVTGKTNCIDALDLFEQTPDTYDLVITDMAMPGMIGTEFAKKLIEIRPDIPIIICTGYSEKLDHEIAMGLGIKAYIHKPIRIEDLSSKVREALDHVKKG